MIDQFGTQGGFEGLGGAAVQFEKASGIFKTAVGEWAFGVLTMQKVLKSDQFKNLTDTTLKLTGVLGGLADTFTKAKMIDVVADLTSGLYDTRKEIEKTYGLFGDDRTQIVDSIRQQSKVTNDFGIRMRQNMESYKALATQFQSTSFDVALTSATSKISKAFNIGVEGASQIVYALNQFGGKDDAEIMDFMNTMDKTAKDAGLAYEAVGENMAASAKHMYRMKLDTKEGEANFKKMLVSSTKMGITMSHMFEAMDTFRTLPEAIEGSVQASLFGLTIGANQLLAIARGKGDKAGLFNAILDRLDSVSDGMGNLSSIGIDMADGLGPMINMSREELVIALRRRKDEDFNRTQMNIEERLKQQQHIQEKIENVLYNVFNVVQPIVTPLLNILEKITSHTKILSGILVATIGGWALYKATTLIGKGRLAMAGFQAKGGFGSLMQGVKQTPKAGWQKIRNNMLGKGAFSPIDPTAVDPSGGEMGPMTKSQKASFKGLNAKNMKLQTNQMLAQSKIMSAQAKQMAASALPMLAFAGGIWILSKAFKQFGEVNWGEAWKGIGVMGAFVGSMLLLGTVITMGWAPMLALGAMMLGFAGSTMMLAKALDMFVKPIYALHDIDFSNIGLGLASLAFGMTSLMLVGGTGLLGIFALGAGVGMVVKTISAIGESASKHATQISILSSALMELAESMERIQSLEDVKEVNIKIDKNTLNSLEKVSLAMAESNIPNTKREIIQNHITVELDGVKLARSIMNTHGVRSPA